MHTQPRLVAVSVAFALAVATHAAARVQHPAMPPGMTHEEHLAQMPKDDDLKKRGAEAMGFDQDKTAHHFRLSRAGGAIEVTVKQTADLTLLEQVRSHLQAIARDFGRGDFGKPTATHAELPPGVAAMQQQPAAVTFHYEELPAGGRVRIVAAGAAAVDAVHTFLRYQIREHATGDALSVSK